VGVSVTVGANVGVAVGSGVAVAVGLGVAVGCRTGVLVGVGAGTTLNRFEPTVLVTVPDVVKRAHALQFPSLLAWLGQWKDTEEYWLATSVTVPTSMRGLALAQTVEPPDVLSPGTTKIVSLSPGLTRPHMRAPDIVTCVPA
jgi:hypothetical protein